MIKFNVLENINLEDAFSYELSLDRDTLAKSLRVTLNVNPETGQPDFSPDDTMIVSILGVPEEYFITEPSSTGYDVTLQMLSAEAKLAKLSANKEIRFISMQDPEERLDWDAYLFDVAQSGGSISDLQYYPLIKNFHYSKFSTATDFYFKVSGGWMSNDILRYIANKTGLSLVTNLPSYHVRQMSIPEGTGYYHAISTLVRIFDPHIRMKDGVLYILDRSAVNSWAGVARFESAERVIQRRLYKESSSRLKLDGGQGPLVQDRIEGQVFLTRVNMTIFCPLDMYEGLVKNFFAKSYGGIPPRETQINESKDERGTLIHQVATVKDQVWDIFHKRKTVIHQLSSTRKYNYRDEGLVLTEDLEEWYNYANLEASYDQPRLQSDNPRNADFPEIKFDNVSKITRRGKLIWHYSVSEGKWVYEFDENVEWEFEWFFYKDNGRLTSHVKRRYAIVYTTHIVPTRWTSDGGIQGASELPWNDSSSAAFKEYSSLTSDSIVTGTIIPIALQELDPSKQYQYEGVSDPRTLVEASDEYYEEITKKAYRKKIISYTLEQTGYWNTNTQVIHIASGDVPYQPVQVRLTNIISKDSYREDIIFDLDRPPMSSGNGLICQYEEADEIREVVKRRLLNPEYTRSYTFPFPIYMERGWLVKMGTVLDSAGNELFSDLNLDGYVTSYSVSSDGFGGVNTNVATEAVQYYE